jgi:hypothetical protein
VTVEEFNFERTCSGLNRNRLNKMRITVNIFLYTSRVVVTNFALGTSKVDRTTINFISYERSMRFITDALLRTESLSEGVSIRQ